MTREQWKRMDSAIRRVCYLMRPAWEQAAFDLAVYGVAVIPLPGGTSFITQGPAPPWLPYHKSILKQALQDLDK